MLPLTQETVVAASKAVTYLYPAAYQLSPAEYCGLINTLLQQACLGVMNHASTHHLLLKKPAKKGRKRHETLLGGRFADNCWPPAFDVRPETEDERFARMVLAGA